MKKTEDPTRSFSKPLDPVEGLVEATEDYLIALQELKKTRPQRNYAVPPFNESYMNHIALKELMKSKAELNDLRKKTAIDEASESNSLNQLVKREEELIGMILSSNDFVEQNKDKKIRSTIKFQLETKKLYSLERELMSVAHAAENLMHVEDIIIKQCKKYQMFEDFLMKVAEKSRSYMSYTDVTNRFEALVGMREKLALLYTKYIDEVEFYRRNMFSESMELTNRILVNINRLKEAEDNLKAYSNATAYWENRLLELSGSSYYKFADLVQVKYFIRNFIQEMINNKDLKPSALELPVEQQVDIIREKYILLKKIVKTIKKQTDETAKKGTA